MIFIITQSRYKTRYVNVVTGEVTIVDRIPGERPADMPPRPRRLAPRVLRRRLIENNRQDCVDSARRA